MMAAAMALAIGLLYLDRHVDELPTVGIAWLRNQDPESARNLLATIAASTITVAGTVFSITIVALTLASNQFGPRVVRNFMRDRSTQIALGIFLATFVYSVMIMRGIDTKGNAAGQYSLSMHAALLLVFVSIAFLIYFIHSVALSIQLDNITFHINQEFSAAIDRIYPRSGTADEEHPQARKPPEELALGDDSMDIFSGKNGYVQMINREKLIDWAEKNDCCIQVECHPGSYMHSWSLAAKIFQPPRQIDSGRIAALVQSTITVGAQPTAEQDIVYSIRQLTQIAVRALSRGVNDPLTAYSCVDRLVDGMGRVLQRPELANCFFDRDGKLRLVVPILEFSDLLATSFDEMREYGRDSGVFMRHLVGALRNIAQICTRRNDIRSLMQYLEVLEVDNREFVRDPFDRETIDNRIADIRKILQSHH